MKPYASFLLLCALAGCSGTQSNTTAMQGPRPPSPGPRAEDGLDDHALAEVAADVQGRTGEDLALAELRLVTVQTRAFVVAVVHALPPISGAQPRPATGDGGVAAPRFDPAATLISQLGATTECSAGGIAHGCAARLGNTLLQRIDALHPPAELAPLKYSLQASLAALEESRVVIDTATRAHVLTDQEDPAAHLAQAVTLLQIRRHVAQAIAINCPCDESAHLAARLSDELAIGTCSDAYEQLLGADGAGAHSAEGMRALAGAGCVPTCARTALAGSGDDPVLEGARACRGETDAVFAPFEDATHSLAHWAATAEGRLHALTDDAAVRAVLEVAPAVPQGAHLPMPPSLFVAGGNRAVDVPTVSGAAGSGVEVGAASALVWIPPTGEVMVRASLQFSLEPVAAVATRSVPVDGIGSAIAAVVPAGETRMPVAVVLDREARAPRFLSVIQHLPHMDASAAPATPTTGIVAFAVRNGVFSRYLPLRLTATAPASYLRVSERQITVVDHDNVAQVVNLAPPPATGADLLGGAIPDAAPTQAPTVMFESDASGLTIARVIDALAVHVGRSSHPEVPQLVESVGDGALTVNVTDAARSTALRAAVDEHRAEAMHCVESAPADAPAVARVDLHLVLNATGHVTRAETATHDAPHLEPAAACITALARRWRLPAPGVANAEIRVPYIHDRGAAPVAAASTAPAASAAPAASGAPHPTQPVAHPPHAAVPHPAH